MRRRFGRRRRGPAEQQGAALDVERELERVVQSGAVPATALEPVEAEEVPAELAAVGIGSSEDGAPRVVGVSPTSGADAWLGAVAVAARLTEAGSVGEVWAVAPRWPAAARRRLGLLTGSGLAVRAVQHPLEAGACEVAPEEVAAPIAFSEQQLAAALPRASERELFRRACDVLRGLGQKHGGRLRLEPDGVALAILARPLAALRIQGGEPVLEAGYPRRQRVALAAHRIAEAFDQVEAAIRKALNDRKLREGEESFRATLLTILAGLARVERPVRWPLVGTDPDPLDFVGMSSDGRVVAGASRRELALGQLGEILDALLELPPRLGALVEAPATSRSELPRLVMAGERIASAVERVLRALSLEVSLFQVESRRGEPVLVPRELAAVPAPAARTEAATDTEPEAQREEPTPALAAEAGRPHRFEELSAFELDEDGGAGAGGAPRGRRRRRRRGRGRGRGRSGEPAIAESEASPEPEEPVADAGEEAAVESSAPGERADRPKGRRRRGRLKRAFEEEDDETLTPLSPEAPDFELEPEPRYEDDEEEGVAEGDSEFDRLHAEREARRRARIAKMEPEPEEVAAPRPPRRRAAIVAHADRDTLGAAVLLAREVRLVEGIWVYPQNELMTFFRSVATDLGEETPIYLVGFTASPARETLQAASLYQSRLFWFDHHVWPPEDLGGLRAAIGADAVHVEEGLGSCLPLVLSFSTRRSRFSDKLTDLLRGRFTQHDYERWGRLWWSRLEEITAHPGERRADLNPLLSGRPSDLAKEAARVTPPEPPPEVGYVAGRDFRLVHFGGHELVLVPVGEGYDLHLAARIARERYAAQLSLAWREGEDRVVLAAEDVPGRPAFGLGSMVDHLVAKFDWVEGLSDADHVARFRIAELPARPERLDEVVAEVAMGRSVLEG